MKKSKVLFAVCLMLMTSTVFAQSEDAWKGVRVAYNIFDTNVEGSDAVMALSAGYVHSFAVSQNIPLFVEAGANLFWVNGDVADGNKLQMWAVELPVNFGYKWNINDDWSIFPYAGATFRGYFSGKLKAGGESFNVFDDDEVNEAWKRFTAGAHVGVTANYKNYNLGVKYGFDLNKLTNEKKASAITISLGYNF